MISRSQVLRGVLLAGVLVMVAEAPCAFAKPVRKHRPVRHRTGYATPYYGAATGPETGFLGVSLSVNFLEVLNKFHQADEIQVMGPWFPNESVARADMASNNNSNGGQQSVGQQSVTVLPGGNGNNGSANSFWNNYTGQAYSYHWHTLYEWITEENQRRAAASNPAGMGGGPVQASNGGAQQSQGFVSMPGVKGLRLSDTYTQMLGNPALGKGGMNGASGSSPQDNAGSAGGGPGSSGGKVAELFDYSVSGEQSWWYHFPDKGLHYCINFDRTGHVRQIQEFGWKGGGVTRRGIGLASTYGNIIRRYGPSGDTVRNGDFIGMYFDDAKVGFQLLKNRVIGITVVQ